LQAKKNCKTWKQKEKYAVGAKGKEALPKTKGTVVMNKRN
jgi:hypothetical protein